MLRTEIIEETVSSLAGIELVENFSINDNMILEGKIAVSMEGLDKELQFDVIIYSQYPFKIRDVDSIRFLNSELRDYNHIMSDGSLCVHSEHSNDIKEKLIYDFAALKAWIRKYFINKETDFHYEHIILPQPRQDFTLQHYYLFSETNYVFKKNEFGYFGYSEINNGDVRSTKINNFIIQNFSNQYNKKVCDVDWSIYLKSLSKETGLYFFIEKAPTQGRFSFESWGELKTLLSQDSIEFLHTVEKKNLVLKNKVIPILLGYKISETEIHWQAILLEIGQFPIYGEKVNNQFITKIDDEANIDWASTKNCSPKYFFGRGKLNDIITKSNILIIGVGAIGSIVAKTLTRGGCSKLNLLDYDIKEPDNICRSEYLFITGITDKTQELKSELQSISPFMNCGIVPFDVCDWFNYFIKSDTETVSSKTNLLKVLKSYDLIIDCTADNDLLYSLQQLQLNTSILNVSISNHAKHLVCGVEANRYEFIMNQFQNVLKFDLEDLHNPTGCWSPTFKASYNDINLLVQYFIKHINLKFDGKNGLRNFVIETSNQDLFQIKLKEF